MSKTAILELDGKKYEFPVIVGTENEVAIDIDALRSASGAITIDPGYKNSGSCKSEITFLAPSSTFSAPFAIITFAFSPTFEESIAFLAFTFAESAACFKYIGFSLFFWFYIVYNG